MATLASSKTKDQETGRDYMSSGLKTEINKQRGEQGQKGIGEFNEDVGGGTPVEGGGRGAMHEGHHTRGERKFVVADSPKDPVAIEAKENGEAVRYRQPRNDDGTFAHNSSNEKELSTKYSRGKFPPGFLRGVDLTYFEKEGVTMKAQISDKSVRVMSTMSLSANDIASACSKYLSDQKGFAGIIGTAIGRVGAQSKEEKKVEKGITGRTDIAEKSASTQLAAEKASEAKDKERLDLQTRIRDFMAKKKFDEKTPYEFTSSDDEAIKKAIDEGPKKKTRPLFEPKPTPPTPKEEEKKESIDTTTPSSKSEKPSDGKYVVPTYKKPLDETQEKAINDAIEANEELKALGMTANDVSEMLKSGELDANDVKELFGVDITPKDGGDDDGEGAMKYFGL